MKRFFPIAIVLLLCAMARAQFTQVSGTVIDPNGLPYDTGTISAILVTNGTSPTLNGQPYQPPTQPGQLDHNGVFLLNLADTSVLRPAGLKWNFMVCSAIGTVPAALGFGSRCFQLATPIAITGPAQDLSVQLQAVALPLSRLFGGGGSGVTTTGGTVTYIPYFIAPTVLGNSGCTWTLLTTTFFCPTFLGNEYDATGTGPFVLSSPFGVAPTPPATGNSAISVDTNGYYSESINGGVYQAFALGVPGVLAAPCTTTANAVQKNLVGSFGCSTMVDNGSAPVTSPNGMNVQQTGTYSFEVPNNASPGTTLNRAVCDDGTGSGEICSHTTSVTNVPLGFVIAGAGTSATAIVAPLGFIPVTFDNTATALHWAIASSTIDGELHDTGSTTPPTGQTYYFIWTGNAGAGTNAVLRIITPDERAAAGTGGGTNQIEVNSVVSRREANFNNSTPAAGTGFLNLGWQLSNISGNLSDISARAAISGNTTTLASAGTLSGAVASTCTDGSGNVTTVGCPSTSTTLNQFYTNEGTTGTTLDTITKLSACNNCTSVTAIITASTDRSNVAGVSLAGICTSGCGTTGQAVIQYGGTAPCVFDGGVTRGDIVGLSSTVAGDCTDLGGQVFAPNDGTHPTIGRVNSPTNAIAGIYNVDLADIGTPQVNYSILGAIPLISTGSTFKQASNLAQRNLGANGGNPTNGGDLEVIYGRNFMFGDGTAGIFQHPRFGGDGPVSTSDLGISGDANVPADVWLASGVYATPVSSTFGPFVGAAGMIQTDILTFNTTLSTSNVRPGQMFILQLCQDGTGGRTFTWPATFLTIPLMPAIANACTIAWFTAMDATHFYLTGTPTPVHSVLSAQTAAIANTVLTHPTATQLIRINGTINCTAVSAGSTVTLNIKYTDTASTVQTVSVTDTCTALVTTGIPNITATARVLANTDVTYGVTIASTPTYDVDVSLQASQ